MNWLDFVIIILFLLNILSGWQTGFIAGATEFLSLIFSLFLAIVTLPISGAVLRGMGFSDNWALFIGFSFVFITIQIVLAIATVPFTKRLKKRIKDTPLGSFNSWFGPLPHILFFMVSTAFFMACFVVFPVYNPIGSAVATSSLGSRIAAPAVSVLKSVSDDFRHETKSPAV